MKYNQAGIAFMPKAPKTAEATAITTIFRRSIRSATRMYIRRNGDIKTLRPMTQPGAHVRGHNAHSLGICYEGGLDAHGHPADTRTDFQKHSLRVLVMLLLRDYPGSRLCGHRDLSPDLNGNGEIEPEEWIKECPCFDAAAIVREAAPPNPGCAG